MVNSFPVDRDGVISAVKFVRTLRTPAVQELQLLVLDDAGTFPETEIHQFTICHRQSFSADSNSSAYQITTEQTEHLQRPVPVKRGQFVALHSPGSKLNLASRGSHATPLFFNNDRRIGGNTYTMMTTRVHKASRLGNPTCGFSVLIRAPEPSVRPAASEVNSSATRRTGDVPHHNLTLAHTANWQTPFCMLDQPVRQGGVIVGIDVKLGKPKYPGDWVLLEFKRVVQARFRLVRVHMLDTSPIENGLMHASANAAPARLNTRRGESAIDSGNYVALYNVTGKALQLCSRTKRTGARPETFLFRPSPAFPRVPLGLDVEGLIGNKFTFSQYENTDHRGSTCPGFVVLTNPDGNSAGRSRSGSPPPPIPTNRPTSIARVHSNPTPSRRDAEDLPLQEERPFEYVNFSPIPYDMTASWKAKYMMSDGIVPSDGVLKSVTLWLGSACSVLGGKLKMYVMESVAISSGHARFRCVSEHDLSINLIQIQSPQTCVPTQPVLVKRGQYICLHGPSGNLNLRSRSRAAAASQTLYFKAMRAHAFGIGHLMEFSAYRNEDSRGKTVAGFFATILPHTDQFSVGPSCLPTTATWKKPAIMLSQPCAANGNIHSVEIAMGRAYSHSPPEHWELHVYKLQHQTNTYKSVRFSVFEPPVCGANGTPGGTCVALNAPLAVYTGEFLCLYSGSPTLSLGIRSRRPGAAPEQVFFGGVPRVNDNFQGYQNVDQRGATVPGFRVLGNRAGRPVGRTSNDRGQDALSEDLLKEDSKTNDPHSLCNKAKEMFEDAASENELLLAIQMLADFNAAGIDRRKLIEMAKRKRNPKVAAKSVWTKDVAKCFGGLIRIHKR
jgi:hypothetical protein